MNWPMIMSGRVGLGIYEKISVKQGVVIGRRREGVKLPSFGSFIQQIIVFCQFITLSELVRKRT